jgi:dCTP deaminase
MFAYIVPRVEWLQKGVSNTSSKVDPGYNGRLLITLFNLGQKKQAVNRADRFCSLVVHDVGPNAVLYDKDAKKISGVGHRRVWQKIRDEIEANRTVVDLALIAATLVLTLAELHLYRAFHSLNELLTR